MPSDESGRPEVFVEPFPPTGERWQISSRGADAPTWRRDGREIFYVSLDKRMVAVPVATAGGFQPGAPHDLFQTTFPAIGVTGDRTPYAVNSDGQRFLVRRLLEEDLPSPIIVAVNWTAALRKER